MADEAPNTQQTDLPGTGGAPAGGAPPAGGAAPAAGGAPAAGAGGKPPAAAAGAGGGKPNGGGKPGAGKPNGGKPNAGGGNTMVSMPSKALRERIDRDAAAKIKRVLGCTLEEAKAKLAAAGSPAAAIAAAGSPAAPAGTDPKVLERLASIERQNKDLRGRLDASKQKTQKIQSRERDKRVSLELRYGAVAAGIADEHADFALDQLAAAVRKAPAGQDPPTPQAFWPALLKARPYLGKGVAPTEVQLRPTTAPPESRAPGEATPNQPAAGTPPPKDDVDKLSDEDFARRTDKLYKFRVPA